MHANLYNCVSAILILVWLVVQWGSWGQDVMLLNHATLFNHLGFGAYSKVNPAYFVLTLSLGDLIVYPTTACFQFK